MPPPSMWLVPGGRLERVLVMAEEKQTVAESDLNSTRFVASWRRSHRLWTAIGNYLFKQIPSLPEDSASIIYNHHPGEHNRDPFGETEMPQVNQPSRRKIKLWAIDPQNPTRRNRIRSSPRQTAPTKGRRMPWLPSPPPPGKINHPPVAVSPDANQERHIFLSANRVVLLRALFV